MVVQAKKITGKAVSKKVSNTKSVVKKPPTVATRKKTAPPAKPKVSIKSSTKARISGKPKVAQKAVASKPIKTGVDLSKFKEGEKEYMIPISLIRFDSEQPRQVFHVADGRVDKDTQIKLNELAASIKDEGLIHAIGLEALEDGTFKIIHGERRTRAHILLGLTEIRATMKNDLTDNITRRVYQYVENKHRQDFTYQEEYELASFLMRHGNDGKPMTLTEIAQKLKKAPGDITRFLRYGNEEMQRLWIKPGIITKRESVYKVSNFPMEIKTEILHRVSLPEDDPRHLAKPVSRLVIDAYESQIKQDKAARPRKPELPPVALGEDIGGGGGVDPLDAVMGGNSGSQEHSQGQWHYELSGVEREKLMSTQTQIAGNKPIVSVAELNKTPVHCRVTAQNISGLIRALSTESELMEVFNGLLCEITVPRTMATKLASLLAGNMVNEDEVDSVLQQRLVKLK